VIKSLAYFPLQVALNGKSIMNSFLDYCQATKIQTQENSMTADAAVIWSVLWHGRLFANQAVYEHYQLQNKPVIIIEVGALYRGNTWKIAVNHVNSQGYYGHQENLDWDRPRKLKISLATQLLSRPEIVIAAQHRHSLQVESMEPNWILNQIDQIKKVSDRAIVIRPHPRSVLVLDHLPPGVTIEKPNKVTGSYDSYDMHYDCHAVVNYNSGPGIQAAIAGVRPVVDSSSLAHAVGTSYADIEKPYTVDRDLWLTQICHTEYTPQEIQQGLWLKRIQPALTA
jgi:hypothetical protein